MLCMYVRSHVHMYVCMHGCMHSCMCVCRCVYTEEGLRIIENQPFQLEGKIYGVQVKLRRCGCQKHGGSQGIPLNQTIDQLGLKILCLPNPFQFKASYVPHVSLGEDRPSPGTVLDTEHWPVKADTPRFHGPAPGSISMGIICL